MLAACVASLVKLQVEHLVAIDGAYQLMPGGKGSSGIDQTRAITDTADAIGIGLTLHHLPQAEKFRGNEVEKRNLSLRLALSFATPEDWLFVIDGDEVVDKITGDPRGSLETTELDVAEFSLVTMLDPTRGAKDEFLVSCAGRIDSRTPVRGFLRALPGLRYEANHYTVTDGDRRLAPASFYSEQAVDLNGMVELEHRKHLRDVYRLERGAAFYTARDSACIEKVYEGAST